MEGFKGTPGPWKASDYYEDSTTVIDASGFGVADAPRCQILEGWPDKGFQHWADSNEAHRWITVEEQSANANLIAAAPELLEACLRLQAQFRQAGIESKAGSLNPIEDNAAQIDAVILKAWGQ